MVSMCEYLSARDYKSLLTYTNYLLFRIDKYRVLTSVIILAKQSALC